jgi:two-component system response regulator MprA
MQYADLMLYPQSRRAFRGIIELDLTPLEYELMACFLRQPGQTLSRDELTRRVWGGPSAVQSEAVDATVMHLRRKLEVRGHARIIHPVRGQGYVLR